MAHVVQEAVVDGLADVAYGPLWVGGGDDLVGAGRVLVGGEDADLPPGHLLFVDIHRLSRKGHETLFNGLIFSTVQNVRRWLH